MHVAGLKTQPHAPAIAFDICARPESSIASNLDRQSQAPAPNQRRVAGFTYICTSEAWLYFAVVPDLFS